MPPKTRKTTKQVNQPSLVKYDEIELAEIEGGKYVCLEVRWYGKTSEYNMGDDEVVLKIKDRGPEIKTIKELAQSTNERKKQNKGKRVYACPYCQCEFKPGRRDHCLRHMNGDKERPVACTFRINEEPDLSLPCKLPPVYVRTE